MSKKEKLTATQTDGIQYRRAKTWHIALSQMTGIMQMAFYVLLGYAAYIGNLGFAITTALVGVLITLSRVFDSVTDPCHRPGHRKVQLQARQDALLPDRGLGLHGGCHHPHVQRICWQV